MTPSSNRQRSREMLDLVVANVPDFVLTIDRRYRITFINRTAKGLKMKDVLGRSALEYVSPGEKSESRRQLRQVFATGKPLATEVRARGDGGETRVFLNRLQPIFEKGRVASVLLVATDITERRRAQERLKESQDSYRLIFEGNPNPMVVGDRATYRWLAVNDAAVKHYGYSREEWLRMTARDIHPPDERERLKRYRIGYGLVSHGVWKQQKKDGAIIDVDITTNSLRFHGREAIMGTFRDVTAERRAQAALRQSRQDYLALFQGHPLPMWVGDYATLRILDVNQAAVRAFGYSREDFIGKSILELRRKKDVPLLRERIRKTKQGVGMTYQGPTLYLRKDGTTFEAEVYVSELEFNGRRAFVTSVMDVSEEIKGREAQERFASLFNSSRDGLNFVDLDGMIREVNDALCRMLGYRRAELVGKRTFLSLTPPEYHQMNKEAHRQLLLTGEPVEYEKEYFRKDGSRVPVSMTTFLLRGADGRPSGTAGIVREITQRKRLEREILEIGAREQSRLGRELHDSLGQHLTGISFLAKSLKSQLSTNGAVQTRLAERIAQAASEAVEQVKALAAGLVPADLLPNGLPAALRGMAVQAEKTFGIECAVICPKRLTGMEEASLLHYYRIAQEAVANAAKHSGARSVRILLRETAGRVILEVRDDGKGIRRRAGKGLGLKIMAHRARMLGGTFEIKRGSEGGTVVTCSCPGRRPLL